jgi:2'-5' RNA ligase
MRIFLAVFPPDEIQRTAFGVGESLRGGGEGVSWVGERNLHFTLRFLGEIGEDGLRRAGEAARAAATGHEKFEAALGAPGAFPNAARARVIWLGLSSGAERLNALAGDLDRALAGRGFGRADRPFSPHLTLGRVRHAGANWSAALGAAISLENSVAARFTVDRISVVESTLSPQGSRYDVRAEAMLAG